MFKQPFISIPALLATILLSGSLLAQESPVTGSIDLNMASAELLADTLEGVGIVRAQAIVSYREMHGDFQSIDQLMEVDGIGPAILESNRIRLRVE